ncbi:MAG: hypothetical protein N3D18_08370 [Roseococcus sp.]|nr:hypothetical protein [Roseococcus sp.]
MRRAAIRPHLPICNTRCDEAGRPRPILPSGGKVADITAAATLGSAATPPGEAPGDKGCAASHLRCFLAERGTVAVIPGTPSRKVAIPHDAEGDRLCNPIERSLCGIANVRGNATRYDKTARNLLAAVCLASAITYSARSSPEPRGDAKRTTSRPRGPEGRGRGCGAQPVARRQGGRMAAARRRGARR